MGAGMAAGAPPTLSTLGRPAPSMTNIIPPPPTDISGPLSGSRVGAPVTAPSAMANNAPDTTPGWKKGLKVAGKIADQLQQSGLFNQQQPQAGPPVDFSASSMPYVPPPENAMFAPRMSSQFYGG